MSAVTLNDNDLKQIMSASETVLLTPAEAPPRRTPFFATENGKRVLESSANLIKRIIPPLLGMMLFVAFWAMIANTNKSIPGPVETWLSAVELFSDPFYDKGPNDKGIGWNILGSLYRVGIGFGAAALVGIPLGFLIGRFQFLNQMLSPIISILRPVSPLAWLPITCWYCKGLNRPRSG